MKRKYDDWLLAIKRDFPDKGFDIEIKEVNNEFQCHFTPRHTTPLIFCRDEKSVRSLIFNMYQTLKILQAVENDKSRLSAQGVI